MTYTCIVDVYIVYVGFAACRVVVPEVFGWDGRSTCVLH